MPRRIELELTSERPDGSWTWRAAGAREPRGELDGSILPGGSKVGDVLRAEADFHVDGISVLSVLPPKGSRSEPERIEILGPQREFTPVTSTLVSKGERRGPRRDRPERAPRSDRPPRREGPRGERPERPERPRRERPAPPPPKPKPKKLRPGRAHRDELVSALSPEQQPIAEQLFRGGLPGVRQALEDQNAKAKVEGLPEIPAATVLAIAEELLPRTRVADWLDRAEAALADSAEIALRDLRAVVTSAEDLAREGAPKELASKLREVLEHRASSEHAEWLQDLTASLEGGRVVRALRLSARPPQPNESVPAELATRLTEAAAAAMTADIAPDRWATLLDAVAYSPVRREVVPAGAPAEPGDALLAAVRKHAGRVPAAAALFGIEAPPAQKRAPRAPRPKPAPQKVSRPPLPPLPSGARRIPPPPRPSPAPAVEAPKPVETVEAVETQHAVPAPEVEPEGPHGDVLHADSPAEPPAHHEVVEVVDVPHAVPAPEVEPAGPHGDVLAADAPTHAPADVPADAPGDAPVESAGDAPTAAEG
jgi:hypothetical protein